jgi:hypothetical protein
MKILTLLSLLFLSLKLYAQDKIIGSYRDNSGYKIDIHSNGTFKYNWSFDMMATWAQGTWRINNDTIYFKVIPIYDTVKFSYNKNNLTDSLILSHDDKSEQTTFRDPNILQAGYQDIMIVPEKLFYKKEKLYKIQNGKLVKKKFRGFGTSKKVDPWFSKN